MKMLRSAACCVLFLSACDQEKAVDGEAAPTPAPAAESADPARAAVDSPEPAPSKLFGKDTAKDPCSLLSADMVAAVAEQEAGALTQRKASGLCIYSWKGANPGKANIGFITVHESKEEAASSFARAHKDLSGEQVAAAMKTIGDGAKAKLKADAAAGEKVPDPEKVDTVTKQLATNSMGGGISFKPVAGVGDEAFFQTTRHETKVGGHVIANYANKLEIRVDNLEFDVSFSLKKKSPDAEPVMYEAQCVALAKAVLTGLRK
jgi:hypothetical protein